MNILCVISSEFEEHPAEVHVGGCVGVGVLIVQG